MRRVHHLVLSLAAKLWLTAAVLVVLLAVASTAVRWWLPLAVGQGENLEQLLSNYAGRPVEVGQVAVRWWRWGPEFELRDVLVHSPDGSETVLRLREARVAVNLIGSLLNRRFQPGAITILGGRLTVDRLVGGGVRLAGFGAGGGPEMAGDAALSWFLEQDYVRLEEGELVWRDQRTDAVLRLADLNLNFYNDGDLHRLDGRGQLRGAETGSLHFGADLHGSTADLSRWQGATYLRAQGLPLPYLLGEVPGAPAIAGGLLSGEVWGQLQAGRLARLDGRAAVADLRPAEGSPPLSLAGRLRLERGDGGATWSARLDQLGLSTPAGHWAGADLQARFGWGAGPWPEVIEGSVQRVALASLAPLYPLLAGPAAAMLAESAPTGELESLGFRVALPPEAPAQFALSARFRDLAARPVGRLPGFRGLSGNLVADRDHGRAELAVAQGGVELPHLFRAPLAVDHLNGTLAWEREGAGWSAWGRGLTLGNGDIQVTGADVDLILPGEGASPVLHLAARYGEGDGSRISPYLPAGIMPPGTLAWLDRALVGGRIPAGSLLVYGPLDHFPFKEGGGRFEVRTQVEDFVLEHTQGWPRIEGIRGEVAFLGQSMSVHADAGRIFRTPVLEATATIADLRGKPARLEVTGRARGPGADGLRYLRESPLGERFGRYLEGAEVAGEVTLDLAVSLALDHEHHAGVKGGIGFDGNTVRFGKQDLTLDGASGTLTFTEKALSGKDIGVRFLEQPARLAVRSDPKGNGVEVQASGRMPLDLLARHYPTPLDAYLSGTAAYRASVAVQPSARDGALGARLTVRSDLKGVAVALPEPLGKSARSAEPLEVMLELGDGPERQLQLHYGQRLSAALRLKTAGAGSAVERGRVTVGGNAVLPREPGLVVDGRVERLVPEEWAALAGGTGPGVPLRRIALEVGRLPALGQEFTELGLVVVPAEGGWQVRLAGEAVLGTLTIPGQGDGPWAADLQRLHLGGEGTAPGGPARPADPRKIPSLRVTCADLRYGDRALGKLDLETRSDAAGLTLSALKLVGNHATLTAGGSWAAAVPQAVSLSGELRSDDAGGTLKSFGLATGVDGGQARNEFEVGWTGGPGGFSLADLEGSLHLRIDEGRLLDVKPGVGRLVGLLSIEAVRRRLSLDFSDFFKQGFVFDRLEGRFSLDRGNAYTNDFYIQGPAARIDITGRVGLTDEDYDQAVTVTPAVGGSLAVGGAIAGGPVAGAAVLVLQKLFQSQIEEITRAEYHLTGTWADPTLERIPRTQEGAGITPQERR